MMLLLQCSTDIYVVGLFLPAARYEHAGQWVTIGRQDILEIEAFTSQKSIVALIFEVNEFNFDI